jgi:hypothetical protein
MNGNTQLTTPIGYNCSRMVFSKAETHSVPNSPISYKRINIGSINPDGTVGDLVIETNRMFSFGVSENTELGTQKVNGYTMPICLYTKDSPTKEEKDWVEGFNAIIERIRDHILESKDEIGKYDLDASDLKKLNPLYWKREKGKIVEGQGPVLYAKLIERKKDNKILSVFYDEQTGEEVDPLSLIGKYCYSRAAIKIESVYVGNRITVQVKLYEASVQQQQAGPKRLLQRPTPSASLMPSRSSEPMVREDDDAPAPAAPSSRQDRSEDIADDDDDTPAAPVKVSSAASSAAPARKAIPSKKIAK